MTGMIVGLAVVVAVAFLFLPLKAKVLLSFLLMMQCFNLMPSQLFGQYVWDGGAILMLVTGGLVIFRQPKIPASGAPYLVALTVLLAWLFICFVWSLLIYGYPLLHTIKAARYMVVGYSITLILIRVFSVQPGTLEFLMKWFYWLSFLIMPVFVLQYLLHQTLLFVKAIEYEGALRSIPIFLPFCLLNFWIILVKVLSSERLRAHEWAYAGLAFTVIALTYTRGIYFGVFITLGVLMCTMLRDGTLKSGSAFKVFGAGVLLITALAAVGGGARVVARIASGVQVIGSSDSAHAAKNDDTFNGRLGLAAERFSLSWARNPLLGYGFIHEDDVPADVRSSLRFGTPLAGTAADPTLFSRTDSDGHYTLGFYSADISWADVVIATGAIGALLLVVLMMTIIIGHFRWRHEHPMGYAVQTGLFLEIVMMSLLTFNGDSFFGNAFILAFLMAAYSLTGNMRPESTPQVTPVRPPNLLV